MSMVPVVGDAVGKGGKILRAGFEYGDEVLEKEMFDSCSKLFSKFDDIKSILSQLNMEADLKKEILSSEFQTLFDLFN